MYFIKDEVGNFVDEKSIRKVGAEYFYFSYGKIENGCISYTARERAESALRKLELHNKCGNLGHSFTIECKTYEPVKEVRWVIKDANSNFTDERAISLCQVDREGTSMICYSSYASYGSVGTYIYPSRIYAERVLEYLNEINKIAGFEGIDLRVEELSRENYISSNESTHIWKPIVRGSKGKLRQAFKEIRNKYFDKSDTVILSV